MLVGLECEMRAPQDSRCRTSQPRIKPKLFPRSVAVPGATPPVNRFLPILVFLSCLSTSSCMLT